MWRVWPVVYAMMDNETKPMKKLINHSSKRATAGLLIVLASLSSSRAALLRVPADFLTIQAAVDASVSGDEIKIAAGVYTNQVVITDKSLTLSGPGAILRATPGMSQPYLSLGVSHCPLLGILRSDVVVSGLAFEGERSGDGQPGTFKAISFIGSNGRVEDCRVTGFRGSTLESARGAAGVVAINFLDLGTGVVNVEVLRNTFADNATSVWLGGDAPGGQVPFEPGLLRTTFAVSDNTILGNGPDTEGRQLGILIYAGAAGEVRRNIVTDHAYVGTNDPVPFSAGILADDGEDFLLGAPLVALQRIHFEGNILRNNQIDLLLLRGDESTIVNNQFEVAAAGLRPTGLAFSGDDVLVTSNRFSDLETGILLFGDDPEYGTYLGIASNAVLIANGFCNVATNIVVEQYATHTEQETVECPPPKLDIRAVQLSWPYSYSGYSVQAAPAAEGPWSTLDTTPSLQDKQHAVVIQADNDQQFFRLVNH